MTAPEEGWTDWIAHDGGPCPLPPGTCVQAEVVDLFWHERHIVCFTVGREWRDGVIFGTGDDDDWVWRHPPRYEGSFHDVSLVRYRYVRPRALRELIDLVENLPAPKIPEAA